MNSHHPPGNAVSHGGGEDFVRFLAHLSARQGELHALGNAVQTACHPQVIWRNAQGLCFGAGAVTQRLQAGFAAMPDQEVLSEDVIWSGNPRIGQLGSQRVLRRGHLSGAGPWAEPRGQALRFREVSDIYAKAGRISDVWSVSDSAALCAQLDVAPREVAQRLNEASPPDMAPFRPEIDQQGPYTGAGNDNQWGIAFADLISRMMGGDVHIVPDQYDHACQVEYPGGETGHGPEKAAQFWLGLRGAFPGARFEIQHRIGMADPLMPPRVALRWSLRGKHDGWGPFGAPTGADVHIMGISHAEFGPMGVRREWTLFDAVAVWMQILRQTG